MKQVVLKLNYHDDKARKKILQTISGHTGVDSISLDSKDMKVTVTGDIDPVRLVSKLRKLCPADILSVAEKKKEEAKKTEPAKKPEEKPKEISKDDFTKLMEAYHQNYMKYPPPPPVIAHYRSVEEDPNACVIC